MLLSRLRRADRRLLLALICVACPAVFTPSAAADTNKEVGVNLPESVLFSSVSTFPAGEPFHIARGWELGPGELVHSIGLWQYRLTIDGVAVQPNFNETIVSQDPVDGTILFRPYVFNFPEGMTGTHVFGSTFLGPCQQLVDFGFATGPCAHAEDLVPISTGTIYATITFSP